MDILETLRSLVGKRVLLELVDGTELEARLWDVYESFWSPGRWIATIDNGRQQAIRVDDIQDVTRVD